MNIQIGIFFRGKQSIESIDIRFITGNNCRGMQPDILFTHPDSHSNSR